MPVRRVMVDHITIGVADLPRSAQFYAEALAPLGLGERHTSPDRPDEVSFGPAGSDDFLISTAYAPGAPLHIAFAAETREAVDGFHAAALAAGGVDNGSPGPRPEYSAGYYGAFVLDPDGNNIEAVFHG